MAGAAGSGGLMDINQQDDINERELFKVLHDKTIPAKDKLQQMRKVLNGGRVGINFPYECDGGNTLLHGAVYHGFVDVVELLLEYKADINLKNAESDTPLHIAVSCGSVDIVKMLLKKKALINVQNSKGEAPLHLVLYDKNKIQKTIIHLLMQYKADVNIQNLAGDTILHLAVRQETVQVITLLIGKADVTIKNAAGVTPLDLAKKTKNQEIHDILVSSFNKRDPKPRGGTNPSQDNIAGVASVAKDENQVEQSADAVADSTDTYIASGAKLSIHGNVYHLCLLMMFALRALNQVYDFWLGTEVVEAEQFDDLVFKCVLPNSWPTIIKTLYLQAKHRAIVGNGLNLNDLLVKGNKAQFSLFKYYQSFVKITKAKGLVEASKIDFAICTNSHFNFCVDEPGKLQQDNITLFMKIPEDIGIYQYFFKEGKCFKLITDDTTVKFLMNHFRTELGLNVEVNETDNKPNAENKQSEVIRGGLVEKNTKVKGKKNEIKTQELEDLKNSLKDDTFLRTFLTNLIFVVEQRADNKIVKTEFEAHTKTNLLDTDLFTDAFYNNIFVWYSNKEGVWLRNKAINNMIESITGTINTFASYGISRVHAENLLTSPHKFNKDKLVELNTLMSKYRFVNVETSMESKLTRIQVAQAIEHSGSYEALDSYIFMRLSSLLQGGTQELTVKAFKSPGKHDLLVIDCLSKTEKVTHDQLTTLSNKLLEITTKNSQKKLVLIAPENHALAKMFSSCTGYYKHPVKHIWEDFTNETQDALLATEVYVQGQPVELNQIIDKTETELLKIVPLDSLIGDEGLVLGTDQPTSVGYNGFFYVDRSVKSVNQIVIKKDIFQDKSQRTFKEELASNESDFQNLCKTHPKANVHLIQKESGRFIWIKSQGEIIALRSYIDETNYQSFSEEEFLSFVKQENLVIISDLAGMGKSTVLTHFSNTIKDKCEGTLVFRIDLNDHSKLLENHKSTIFDHSSALDFLFNEIIMIKAPLEKALFKRKGKVVLLFDGFDEISLDFEVEVLGLIQNLTIATEAQIWITTRPFMTEKLEDKLRRWSSSLQPFSKQNQVDFLTKYWKHMKNVKDSDEGRIKDIASSFVSQLSKSISDKEREFTGIPLQMKMLAECFIDDLDKSPDLGKCVNLVDLYHTFMVKKFEVYHIEKNKTDVSKGGVRRDLKFIFDLYIKQHQWLALSVILSDEKPALLLPDYKNLIDLAETIPNINRIGIVNVTNDKPQFVHRTFAEYCVALYFVELLKDPKSISSDVRSFIKTKLLIRSNYLIIRAFLNGLLANCNLATDSFSKLQGPVLTSDDINTKYKRIKAIFRRTAVEGNDHIFIYLLNSVKGNDEKVHKLLEDSFANNETMLHLAAKKNNAKFIKTFMTWTRDNTGRGQEILNLMLLAGDDQDRTALVLASFNGHNAVVQTLLDWTRYNLEKGQEKVKRMLASDNNCYTPLLMASMQGHNDVVQTLLKWTHANLDEGEEIVKLMLKACDSDGETSLHMASKQGRSDVVLTLLQWTRNTLVGGQEIVKRMLETCDSKGQTSLHFAQKAGQSDVSQILLQWTPKNLDNGTEIVKRILEACDIDGLTSLHIASAEGCSEVVLTLLQYTRNTFNDGQERVTRMLESLGSRGQTSLHLASEEGNSNVVETLLQWTRDNLDGYLEIVKRILEACNKEGQNALQIASAGGRSDVVHTLLQWTRYNLDNGQEMVKRMLTACGSRGHTSLYIASVRGRSDVVQTLLQWTRYNLNDGQELVKRMIMFVTAGIPACHGTLLDVVIKEGPGGSDMALMCGMILKWTRENMEEGQDLVKQILLSKNKYGNTILYNTLSFKCDSYFRELLKWIIDNVENGKETVNLMLLSADGNDGTVLGELLNYGMYIQAHLLLQWTLDNMGEGTLRELLLVRKCKGKTALEVVQKHLTAYNDCKKMLEWALGNRNVNLREHITALKNRSTLDGLGPFD